MRDNKIIENTLVTLRLPFCAGAAFTYIATLAAAAKLTARCIACSKYKELVNKVLIILKDAIMAALRTVGTLLTSSL